MTSHEESSHQRPIKHFVNDTKNIVVEALRGICLTFPHLRLIEQEKGKADIDEIKNKQVTLISGGGAGHEPAHAGFVGPNLLSAAVSGNIFASPSTSQILAAIRRVQSPHGTLLIVKNYTGDCLNFGLAAERAKAEGIKVDVIIVGDDVGVGKEQGGLVGRRGLAGTVFVHKVAGAIAAKGATLEDTKAAAELVARNIGTIGVAFDHCIIPGSQSAAFLSKDEIELGMGLHNEPGYKKISLTPSRELVRTMLDTILDTTDPDRSFLDIKPNRDSIALLVNNLGGLSAIEGGVVVKDAIEYLEEKQFQVKRVYLGHFMTSLSMPGVSLTILKLPIGGGEKVLEYLDEPVQVPGWQNRIVVDSSGLQQDLDEKVSRSRLAGNDNIEHTIGVDSSSFQKSIALACQAAIKAEPVITKYDMIVGDGDCGTTLKNGATAILDAFDEYRINTKNVPEAIRQISDILENSMGGTSGAIYCIFLNGLANGVLSTAVKHPDSHSISIDAKCWAESLKIALTSLSLYTKAKVGDRTLMDTLIPFIETFTTNTTNDTHQALRSALNAAQQGAENTRTLKARLGRASYISDESIKEANVPDPGAWGLVTILNGLLGSQI